jgi:oligoribonuclease
MRTDNSGIVFDMNENKKTFKSTKLLWIDLEMTGLNPDADRIVEIGAIVTDFNFNEIAVFESVVHQPDKILNTMNEWSRTAHTKSGLLEKIKVAPKEKVVEKEFLDFIKANFKDEPVVIAGNSIHQDRRFIDRWWPKVSEALHYRMVDVSSFKIIMQTKYNRVFNKKESHRALEDIRESIAELKFYLYLEGRKR